MLRRLLRTLGLAPATASIPAARPPYAPYAGMPAANDVYNLLFCDLPERFQSSGGRLPVAWQQILDADPIDEAGLRSLADDAAQDSRLRYLAYSKLLRAGRREAKKVLLGVIVEIPMKDGLDALAAYADRSARYVNRSGKMALLDPAPQTRAAIDSLLEAAGKVVERIGPWNDPRLAPPASGRVRLTFLVSDGLYFGEGPSSIMSRDPMAGPVIKFATELLLAVTRISTQGA